MRVVDITESFAAASESDSSAHASAELRRQVGAAGCGLLVSAVLIALGAVLLVTASAYAQAAAITPVAVAPVSAGALRVARAARASVAIAVDG
ncbi:MAG: hypothetical protein ACREON_16085, partial [Gemmatimonadaceae bacterium]